MNAPLRTVKRLAALCLILFMTVGAGPTSCMINALIVDPPTYDFLLRRISTAVPPYQTSSATTIDVPVYVYGTGDYSFKVGVDASTDCANVTGYTPWTVSTTRLQADISAIPDGNVKLCLVGRKLYSGGIYVYQPYTKATVYKWIKDVAGPGAFNINPLATPSNDPTPDISWQPATDATSYNVIISALPDCSTSLQTFNNVTTTSVTAAPIPDGSYHVCVSARDAASNVTQATNNGIQGVIDTVPPGAFNVMTPSGNVTGTQQMAQWSASDGATSYHLMLTSDAACDTMLNEWNNLTGTQVMIDVPASGSYYLCAEAFDDANNMTEATASQFTVIPTPTEVVVKDHITDVTCWNNNQALYHYNDPGDNDGIVAAAITGGGGIIKRVGGIFSDADCSTFNTGLIENMNVSVAFYESAAVFLADPYLVNQLPGSASKRVAAVKLHTEPTDPQYFLNPVRTTPSGTQQFFIEVDVSSENLQTTVGGEHLVALWFSSDQTTDGQTWMAFSSGCPGQVGALPDYYRSENNTPALGPGTLQSTGATHPNAAYFVTELR